MYNHFQQICYNHSSQFCYNRNNSLFVNFASENGNECGSKSREVKTMKYLKAAFVLWVLMVLATPSRSQIVYTFETVHSPVGCEYTYDVDISLKLDSALVTNIYFDDMVSNGSFAFETLVSYDVVFSNSTLPPGNFFTFQPTLYSENVNLSTPTLTNNLGSVPLQTSSAGGFQSLNNPTYAGSASALGLAVNQYYSSLSILNTLGYDHASIVVNLPCLDTLIEADDDPLPVKWLGFSASAKGSDVTLRWQTLAELSSSHYDILRSDDAKKWVSAGSVPSKATNGESLGRLNYQYAIREEYPGTYYYKVVQTDFDGTQTPGPILTATVDFTGDDLLYVYPNPAHSQVRIKLPKSDIRYEIFDNNGRLTRSGIFSEKVDVSDLTPGVYTLKVLNKSTRLLVSH